jgi:small subunit ribosomal protein S4e
MIMAHLRRYNIPVYWNVPRKERTFVIRPRSGPHPLKASIPILVVLRDILKLAETSQEAKSAIKKGAVLVDKKERKDPNFPVGLMDLVEIPAVKKAYRVTVNKRGLVLDEVKDAEDTKLCKIRNKVIVTGGKTQLNLHDGRNVLVENGKDYKPNDSVVIKLPEQKILKHIKFEKGSHCLIISGKNIGMTGEIKEITGRKTMFETNMLILQTKDREIETVRDYVLVGEFK